MNSIEWQSPLGITLLCIIIAVLLTGILYYRSKSFDRQPAVVKAILPLLRLLTVAGILLLLLDPSIKSSSHDEIKPILLVAQDASRSMALNADTNQIKTLINQINESDLQDKYDIQTIHFSDQIANGSNFSFDGKSTDFSRLMNYINDQYQGRNLSASILVSDGILNQGSHPYYSINKITAPIFSLALGDTSINKDLRLVNIFHNETALLGDDFEVQIDWHAQHLKGEKSKIEVTRISPSPKKVFEKYIKIDQEDVFGTESIQLSGEPEGLHHYNVRLRSVNGEYNLSNNSKDFYIEIIDSKIKVLLLARAPHPDIGMLRRIISNRKNYDLDIVYLKDVAEIIENKYDLVVYHDLPSDNGALKTHFQKVKTLKIPYLIMMGNNTNIPLLNNWQQVMTVSKNNNQSNYVLADINEQFQSFNIEEIQTFPWTSSPPLKSIFGDFKLALGAQALLNQTVGKISTDYPLVAINEKPYRHGVISGIDWWKLRMFEYLNSNEQVKIDLLFTQLFQYLSLKEDKRPLVAKSNKKLFNSNEPIIFNALLRNDNYESVNEADLSIKIRDQDGKTYDFLMDREKSAYRLDIGNLPAADYSYTASTTFNNKKYQIKGKFSVKDIQLEEDLLTADHDLLRQIAQSTEGNVYYSGEYDQLYAQLMNDQLGKTILSQNVKLSQLIDIKWIMFLIALLLFAEWIIRKYYGAY